MKNTRPNPALIDNENPEWTDKMFVSAGRVTNLPLSPQAKLQNKGSCPVSENLKVSTTVRFDAQEVLAAFKATGKGVGKNPYEQRP